MLTPSITYRLCDHTRNALRYHTYGGKMNLLCDLRHKLYPPRPREMRSSEVMVGVEFITTDQTRFHFCKMHLWAGEYTVGPARFALVSFNSDEKISSHKSITSTKRWLTRWWMYCRKPTKFIVGLSTQRRNSRGNHTTCKFAYRTTTQQVPVRFLLVKTGIRII